MDIIGLLAAIATIIAGILGWYFDKDRLRGKALSIKRQEGKAKQKELDNAIKLQDYKTLSAIALELHDSLRMRQSAKSVAGQLGDKELPPKP